MTNLSPRLAHLLIREDRATGQLFMPDGSHIAHTGDTGLTPPLSPLSFPIEASPLHLPRSLPSSNSTLLPPPRHVSDRRPSQSIFSLLNDVRISSPPPSSRSAGSSRLHQSTSPTPHTAVPLPSSMYEPRGRHFIPLQHQRPSLSGAAPSPGRPDMPRRHSSHPYEYPSAPGHRPYSPPMHSEQPIQGDFVTISGSRAPISRTTKACNACRSRKVRCDAGGSSGEPTMCSRCKEAGVECVYSGPQKKRGPCPGTVRPSTANTLRPSTGNKSRRPSNRSSVTSINTTYVTTPTSEDEWSGRTSYGFLPHLPAGSSSKPPSRSGDPYPKPAPGSSHGPRQPSMPVLSWPGMQPAMEIDESMVPSSKVFRADYSMRVPPARHQEQRGLPPLRVAIEQRESYYTP